MAKKKIIDARGDEDGDITHVKFRGNSSFTSVERAIPMAKRGEIEDVHVSKTGAGKEYLRTNPNKSKQDNLDTMVGDD